MQRLHELSLPDLTERLIDMAQKARRHAEEGDVVALHDLLATVRESADEASGPASSLLQVAEAHLRAIARSDLGRTELALRRFASGEADVSDLLSALADGGVLRADELQRLGASGAELCEVGVLRALDGGRWDLRPALRNLARNLAEPVAFRLWRRVEEARGQAALGAMRPPLAAAHLSERLGVTAREASAFLRRSPLARPTLPRADEQGHALAFLTRDLLGSTQRQHAGAWLHGAAPQQLGGTPQQVLEGLHDSRHDPSDEARSN